MNGSGFAMDDAEDDGSTTQMPGGKGLNASLHLQKKKRSDQRAEWINAQLTTKVSHISSQKRRKVNAPSRVHGHYQPATESDLSSDSESLEEEDLSGEDSYSSITYASSSDTSAVFSSSCSDLNVDDDDEQQSERSVSTSNPPHTKHSRPVRTGKSKASTTAAAVTATNAKSSTKAASNQAIRSRTTTNAAKITTATITSVSRKDFFDNLSRIPAIRRPAAALPTVLSPPQHHPIAEITPRPITTANTKARFRSRPPRQIRFKTGRWTKAEDNALYKGVVEYLARFGLEPKPPAHLPLQENPKEVGIEEEDQACEYEHEDVFGKLRSSAPEQLVDESRRRIEYDAVAVWKATATVCQMSEPYRVSNLNHDHTSESDVVRDGENDLHLFDELVDISRDNVQAESDQDGYLNLESRAGLVHHTLLLPPFRVSSPIENAGVNTSTKFAAESGFLNAHGDFSPSGDIFVRATTRPPPPTIKPQETCIGVHNQNTQVFDDYPNYKNNLYHQHHQQQPSQFQQQYNQHLREVTYTSQDQNHHHMQQYHRQPFPVPQQQHHYHQQPHGLDQQYSYPGIQPHLGDAPYETQTGDVWLAPINGVDFRTLQPSKVPHRGDLSISGGAAFANLGDFTREGSSINRTAIFAAEEAAIEMALFNDLFPDTTNNTTITSASPPPTLTITPVSTTASTTASTPPPAPFRYRTQSSYASAISRRLTTCPWSHIASSTVPGRTGVQAQARWSEALDPRVKKGPWSEEEDALLLDGVERSDKCWIWIADSIEGRTQRQCRTRWVQLTINAERKAALAALEGVTEF
ncbi:Myb- protein B [Linnemannia elongata]|nr:Myb- protein B [Linnemannia elongata]